MNFFIALGIGILVSAILMNLSFSIRYEGDIETQARRLGMVYPEEVKSVEVNP